MLVAKIDQTDQTPLQSTPQTDQSHTQTLSTKDLPAFEDYGITSLSNHIIEFEYLIFLLPVLFFITESSVCFEVLQIYV